MRGKLCACPCSLRQGRITPADAGKTPKRRFCSFDTRDHPRGCGENASVSFSGRMISGSPPRMRGKLSGSLSASLNARITPADAGKTARITSEWSEREDHPRGCGENLDDAVCARDCGGSPPRMRGKRRDSDSVPRATRITPADAGKTALDAVGQVEPPGSPPRMRGKPNRIVELADSGRITPADAGKTHVFFPPFLLNQDHPRGCGENLLMPSHKPFTRGSPPRMRGKLHSSLMPSKRQRITPADAGKTQAQSLRKSEFRDHPRGCGENPAFCARYD